MYVYTYVYTYVYICIYMYIYRVGPGFQVYVEECPAPKQSYSDSLRFVKPERPFHCRSVSNRSRRPVQVSGLQFIHLEFRSRCFGLGLRVSFYGVFLEGGAG